MTNPLDLVAEVWEALKFNIDSNERPEAADSLVNLLIEHDHEVSEIRDAFKGDKTINAALRGYVAAHEDEFVDEDADEPEDRDPD
jgi:hypothetical protein